MVRGSCSWFSAAGLGGEGLCVCVNHQACTDKLHPHPSRQLHLVSPGPAMSQPWRAGAGGGWTGEKPVVGPGSELRAFEEECGISLPLSLVQKWRQDKSYGRAHPLGLMDSLVHRTCDWMRAEEGSSEAWVLGWVPSYTGLKSVLFLIWGCSGLRS